MPHMFERLRRWAREHSVVTGRSRSYCAICREYLPPRGGGIEVAHLERVCSETCADEHASHAAW